MNIPIVFFFSKYFSWNLLDVMSFTLPDDFMYLSEHSHLTNIEEGASPGLHGIFWFTFRINTTTFFQPPLNYLGSFEPAFIVLFVYKFLRWSSCAYVWPLKQKSSTPSAGPHIEPHSNLCSDIHPQDILVSLDLIANEQVCSS